MNKSNHRRSKPNDAWVRDSQIVRKWESIKKEILDHKWYESEKAGHDIGWDRAVVDWMIQHGATSSGQPRCE